MTRHVNIGAVYLGQGRCRFRVWSPFAERIDVRFLEPEERLETLLKGGGGYHEATLTDVYPGANYYYRISEGHDRPDPASRFQPCGVHGPSRVADQAFTWTDQAWTGIPLSQYIIYEIHIGAYTPEGTFDAAASHLNELVDLGVTAVEIMPIAQFPGDRNWGYDGAHPFAVQDSYGGIEGLKRLVDECHRHSLAVILDVVYNHLGPEGNYLAEFAPYFTDRYRTPWGGAINFDGPYSDDVREYFIQNAVYWATEFHVDALRLDAVHAIFDFSAKPFLQELAEEFEAQSVAVGRRLYLIAESNQNDIRLVNAPDAGGYGLNAVWNDDFHHAVHTLLTGESSGYYADFGRADQLKKSLAEGFIYAGDYSIFRKRRHGISSRSVPAEQFVVFTQNHDQIGNRMKGERLTELVSLEAVKIAAGLTLLSPYIPLLFMGEEYGETAPFPYFVSHTDPELVEAVRRGRREEFISFGWSEEPPDPQSEATFRLAKLNRRLATQREHAGLYEYYRELIRLRKTMPALFRLDKAGMAVSLSEDETVLTMLRRGAEGDVMAVFYFSTEKGEITISAPKGIWKVILDSNDPGFAGPGSTVSGVLRSTDILKISVPGPSLIILDNS